MPLKVNGTSPARVGNTSMTELARKVIAEAARSHARNRQAAGGDDQGRAFKRAGARLDKKSALSFFHILNVATRLYLHTCVGTFIEQHAHNLLGRNVAEQLAEFFLVPRNAVCIDQGDEIGRGKSGQRRLAIMRIG